MELIPTADDDDFSAAFSVQTRRSRTILCRAENKFDNQTRRIDLVVKSRSPHRDIPFIGF